MVIGRVAAPARRGFDGAATMWPGVGLWLMAAAAGWRTGLLAGGGAAAAAAARRACRMAANLLRSRFRGALTGLAAGPGELRIIKVFS
jgi:hypothetical protein